MKEVRGDAAGQRAEERERREVGRLDAEREVRVRQEREGDGAPFLDPRPRHGEVVRDFVERRRRRLRHDHAGNEDDADGERRQSDVVELHRPRLVAPHDGVDAPHARRQDDGQHQRRGGGQ